MRAFARILAGAYLLGNVCAALFMAFYATFPFENQTPEEQAGDDWLIGVGILAASLALVTLIAVVLERRLWAIVPFVADAALGLVLLRWAVGVSDHSDRKLIVWVLAIELTGFGAVALGAGRSDSPTRL